MPERKLLNQPAHTARSKMHEDEGGASDGDRHDQEFKHGHGAEKHDVGTPLVRKIPKQHPEQGRTFRRAKRHSVVGWHPLSTTRSHGDGRECRIRIAVESVENAVADRYSNMNALPEEISESHTGLRHQKYEARFFSDLPQQVINKTEEYWFLY